MRLLSGSIIILAGTIAITGAAVAENFHSSPGYSELTTVCAILGVILLLVGFILAFLGLPSSKSREDRNYFL